MQIAWLLLNQKTSRKRSSDKHIKDYTKHFTVELLYIPKASVVATTNTNAEAFFFSMSFYYSETNLSGKSNSRFHPAIPQIAEMFEILHFGK